MRTTIPKAADRSAQDSYGPRSHPPHVTGNKQNQRMAAKPGRRIGYRTSSECHSLLFRELGRATHPIFRPGGSASFFTSGSASMECAPSKTRLLRLGWESTIVRLPCGDLGLWEPGGTWDSRDVHALSRPLGHQSPPISLNPIGI